MPIQARPVENAWTPAVESLRAFATTSRSRAPELRLHLTTEVTDDPKLPALPLLCQTTAKSPQASLATIAER